MKLSTKIMITLIASGVVIIAALFSFVRCTGETPQWANPIHITEAETTLPLSSRFTNLNVTIDTNVPDGFIYFSDKMDIEITQYDAINMPEIVVAETFAGKIDCTVSDSTLNLVLKPDRGYYVADNSRIMNILVPRPVTAAMFDTPKNIRLRFNSMKTDSLSVKSSDSRIMTFTGNTIGTLSIVNPDDIYVANSNICSMTLFNDRDMVTNVDISDDSEIDSLTLLGGKYACNLQGLEAGRVKVIPDSTKHITLTTVY